MRVGGLHVASAINASRLLSEAVQKSVRSPTTPLACTWHHEASCALLLDSAPCLTLKLAVSCITNGVERLPKRRLALRKTAVVDMCQRSLALAKKREALREAGGTS